MSIDAAISNVIIIKFKAVYSRPSVFYGLIPLLGKLNLCKYIPRHWTVIDEDQFEIRERLAQNTFNALADIFLNVIYRNYDADFRHWSPASI